MVTAGATRLAERLRYSREFQLFRYAAAGVCISLGYTVTVFLLVDMLHATTPPWASGMSFVLWTPLSYWVHRDFTFRSADHDFRTAVKFGSTFFVRLTMSMVVVYLFSNVMHLHYIYGALANWVVLPLLNYFVLEIWVFAASMRRPVTKAAAD